MDRQSKISEDDWDFLLRCMRSQKRQMFFFGIVIVCSGPLFAWMFTFAGSTLGKIALGLGAVFGTVMGVFMIRLSRKDELHPWLVSLRSNPQELTDLELTNLSFSGARTGSGYLSISVKGVRQQFYFDKGHKRERFLKILLEQAPHLARTK